MYGRAKIEGLFTPWTMKSSQGLVKSMIGCWTRHETTLIYIKEKECQSDHGVRGPQKTYFEATIIQWHGSMGFAVAEVKHVLR